MIREASKEDFERIWPIFESVARRGDTYAYPCDISYEQAFNEWMLKPRRTYLFEKSGEVLGTYYVKTNHDGPGDHVCNCGYMVAESARGLGIATHLCEHSQNVARDLGYLAMQFNFVASTNIAVTLWRRLGFDIVGTLPQAFRHPQQGLVDAYLMYKTL